MACSSFCTCKFHVKKIRKTTTIVQNLNLGLNIQHQHNLQLPPPFRLTIILEFVLLQHVHCVFPISLRQPQETLLMGVFGSGAIVGADNIGASNTNPSEMRAYQVLVFVGQGLRTMLVCGENSQAVWVKIYQAINWDMWTLLGK
jgi:hypothetical protein